MIQPGTYQTLISTRTTPQGLYQMRATWVKS